MTNELTTNKFNYEISSLEEAMKYANMIAESDLAPKDYKGKPGNVLIAMQFGAEVGLKPMQAIQNISIINGRPAVWGDAMLALVVSHPLCLSVKEWADKERAYCQVHRRGDDEPYTYDFSWDDAKKASLVGKAGPWTQYPDRMLQMRARGFALRDKFPDILKGICSREELEDYVIEASPQEKRTQAISKVDLLIASKNEAPIEAEVVENYLPFEDVHCMMMNATNVEELNKAAEFAIRLSDSDKEKARAMYKTRYLAFASAQTGDLGANKQE